MTRWESWKSILRIAWPLVIANAFWNLQVTIDRIFLAQYSSDALGAAIAAVGVFWAPMALLQQTAAYVSTFVAQYSGAKQAKNIGPALWQSFYLSLAGGLLFLLLIPVTPFIFEAFAHSENIKILEIEYFRALCYSALPTALVAAVSGFFTGIERSQLIMKINAVGLIANVILDYLLIFGNFGFPALGIAGAGYATTLAGFASAFYGLYLIFEPKYQTKYATRSSWKWNFSLMQRFLKFGIPSGMQWALEGLAFTGFLIVLGRMPEGDAALAASGITVTIMMLSVLPAFGIAQAVSVLVGKHLGENKPQLSERYSWSGLQISALYIGSVGLTFLLFPNFYLSWFHNSENRLLWSQISEIVPYLLMFVAAFTLFDSINLVFSFALKGAGDTRFVSLVALVMPWPLMVYPTWLFRNHEQGVYWAWGAASLYIMLQAVVFWIRFVGGKWKSMRVIENSSNL
jgi:multidrug resistance protein, MATE family